MNNPCSETSSSASTSKPFDGRFPHRHTNRICVENVLNTPHASTDRVRTTSPPQVRKFSCPPLSPRDGQRCTPERAKKCHRRGKGTLPGGERHAPPETRFSPQRDSSKRHRAEPGQALGGKSERRSVLKTNKKAPLLTRNLEKHYLYRTQS